jgi:hypothetical protein
VLQDFQSWRNDDGGRSQLDLAVLAIRQVGTKKWVSDASIFTAIAGKKYSKAEAICADEELRAKLDSANPQCSNSYPVWVRSAKLPLLRFAGHVLLQF